MRSSCWTTCPPGTPTRCPPAASSSRATCAPTPRRCWPPGSRRSCTSRPSPWSPSPCPARQRTGSTTSAARWRCWRRCARRGCGRIVFSSTAADLRRAGVGADRGDRPDPADQPVRRLQARRRHRAGRVRPDARPGRGQPALLQRGRRLPGAGRGLARRAARPRDAPDPDRARRAAGAGEVLQHLRRRLPHPGRHLRPGLHPRLRPGPARTCWRWPPASPARTGSATWAAGPGSPTARCSPRAAT